MHTDAVVAPPAVPPDEPRPLVARPSPADLVAATSGIAVSDTPTRNAALAAVAELLDADRAYLFALDGRGARLRMHAATAGAEEWVGRLSVEVGTGVAGWAALHRTPAVIREHPERDPRYFVSHELGCQRYRSIMAQPLIAASGRLVGVLSLYAERSGGFAGDVPSLAASLGSLVAAALEASARAAAAARHAAVAALLAEADDLSSPAAAARTFHGVAEAARLATATDVAVLAARDGAGRWTLRSFSSDRATVPRTDRLAAAPLDSLLDGDAVQELGRRARSELPAALGLPEPGEASAVAAPVRVSSRPVGVLLCLGGAGPLPDGADLELRVVAQWAALALQNAELLAQQATGRAEWVLLDALAAGAEPEAVLAARARRFGLDPGTPHLAVAVDVSPADGGGDPETALAAVCEALRRAVPGVLCAADGIRARALLPAPRPLAPTGQVLAALAASAPRDIHWTVGVSARVTGVREFARGLAEAHEAAAIGAVVRPPGAVVRFDELGADRHLWALAREPARDVLQVRLETLQRYDEEQGTALFATAEALLEASGNQTEAAARLYVHRNTLRQRLDRIRRIAGLDLADGAARFDLQVALRVVRFRALLAAAR